jgi:hypothetical protein
MMSVALHDLPELGGEGREVIDAALHLIDEEMQIAERLERKAREQWQLVAFMAPVAIGTALTAVSAKGVGKGWIISIAVIGVLALALVLAALKSASEMSNVQAEKSFNPDLLDAYVADLHDRRAESSAFDQVRASLATSLVQVARSRAKSNDTRRERLAGVIFRSRLAVYLAALDFVVAAIAVVVNA